MVRVRPVLAALLLAVGLSAQEPGWIGVFLGDPEQPTIAEVVPGSPAEAVGMRPRDVILSVDGRAVPSAEVLAEVCGALRAGQRVDVVLRREGVRKVVRVQLAERPEGVRRPGGTPKRPGGGRSPAPAAESAPRPAMPRLGLVLQELDPGLVVLEVEAGSRAARAGVRPGDRLRSSGGSRCGTFEQFEAGFEKALQNRRLDLVVVREVAGALVVRPVSMELGGESAQLLVFVASWCENSRAQRNVLAACGRPFELVDADGDPARTKRFGVSALPHFVILRGGRPVAQRTGFMPAEELAEWLESGGIARARKPSKGPR